MPKNLRNTFIVAGVLAAGDFSTFQWLFKEPGDATLWGPQQALKYYDETGQHHPKLSKFTRESLKSMSNSQN